MNDYDTIHTLRHHIHRLEDGKHKYQNINSILGGEIMDEFNFISPHLQSENIFIKKKTLLSTSSACR